MDCARHLCNVMHAFCAVTSDWKLFDRKNEAVCVMRLEIWPESLNYDIMVSMNSNFVGWKDTDPTGSDCPEWRAVGWGQCLATSWILERSQRLSNASPLDVRINWGKMVWDLPAKSYLSHIAHIAHMSSCRNCWSLNFWQAYWLVYWIILAPLWKCSSLLYGNKLTAGSVPALLGWVGPKQC